MILNHKRGNKQTNNFSKFNKFHNECIRYTVNAQSSNPDVQIKQVYSFIFPELKFNHFENMKISLEVIYIIVSINRKKVCLQKLNIFFIFIQIFK